MSINVSLSSPISTVLTLSNIAFGNLGKNRPTFSGITEVEGARKFIFKNQEVELDVDFKPLNYDYVNSLSQEDVTIFNQEEFGKFFYEYGRSILVNTFIDVSRLNWFASDPNTRYANGEFNCIDEYYRTLYVLDGKFNSVMEVFKTEIFGKEESDETMFRFDFSKITRELLDNLSELSNNKETPDMHNSKIILNVYSGITFVILGCLLITGNGLDANIIDGLKSITSTSSIDIIFDTLMKCSKEKILDVDATDIVNILKMTFIRHAISNLYKLTSGIVSHDDVFINTMDELSRKLIVKLNGTENEGAITAFIPLLKDISSCFSIAEFRNIFGQTNSFYSEGTIRSDDTDIWKFGREFFRTFSISNDEMDLYKNESRSAKLSTMMIPQMKSFISNSMLTCDDTSVEQGLNYVSSIINGLDNTKVSTVDPATILQLTIVASAFRSLEKKTSSILSEANKRNIHFAVDAIDSIIVTLYHKWFDEGKFFIQPSRPKYCHNSAKETLELLQKEVNDILCVYFEFVKYDGTAGVPKDSNMSFVKYVIDRHSSPEEDGVKEVILNEHFIRLDSEVYVRECALRGSRSFAYSALCYGPTDKLSVEYLTEIASKTDIPKSIIKSLTRETKDGPTKIRTVDNVCYIIDLAKDFVQEEPFVYMISVYSLLYSIIDSILRTNNVANYFDFKSAEESVGLYRIESIVSELLIKPARKEIETDISF